MALDWFRTRFWCHKGFLQAIVGALTKGPYRELYIINFDYKLQVASFWTNSSASNTMDQDLKGPLYLQSVAKLLKM